MTGDDVTRLLGIGNWAWDGAWLGIDINGVGGSVGAC
jgi:hypothetical protein